MGVQGDVDFSVHALLILVMFLYSTLLYCTVLYYTKRQQTTRLSMMCPFFFSFLFFSFLLHAPPPPSFGGRTGGAVIGSCLSGIPEFLVTGYGISFRDVPFLRTKRSIHSFGPWGYIYIYT